MKNGIANPITWTTRSRGWRWTAEGGWEIRRDVRHEDGATQFVIWHHATVVDIRATLEIAKLTAESEMTRERIS